MKRAIFIETKLGKIGVAERDNAITNVFFGGTVRPEGYIEHETPVLLEAAEQLNAYFAGTLREFTVPVLMEGTAFQQKVWRALTEIPYGETRSYGQLAQAIFGRSNAARAVGHANARNPISIIVPCHRVIGAGGVLTGYAGGLAAKELLLKLEGAL
ncbi:MAG TPA: methylated-DNA--[protein]-cysteine S-methyltransferase [Feifaniaceae bacterium]|nr:methylated-DNA--[protein]-cysteine S-methyltransferase [Feifaniaceae bacterium]